MREGCEETMKFFFLTTLIFCHIRKQTLNGHTCPVSTCGTERPHFKSHVITPPLSGVIAQMQHLIRLAVGPVCFQALNL